MRKRISPRKYPATPNPCRMHYSLCQDHSIAMWRLMEQFFPYPGLCHRGMESHLEPVLATDLVQILVDLHHKIGSAKGDRTLVVSAPLTSFCPWPALPSYYSVPHFASSFSFMPHSFLSSCHHTSNTDLSIAQTLFLGAV